jgi:hypothetical protein
MKSTPVFLTLEHENIYLPLARASKKKGLTIQAHLRNIIIAELEKNNQHNPQNFPIKK